MSESVFGRDLPYTRQVMKWDLSRVREDFRRYRASRDRDAVYRYLRAVFNIVELWKTQGDLDQRVREILDLNDISDCVPEECFSAVIVCTADPRKVDDKMRSKWSRVLRYAARKKWRDESLKRFIKRRGGINSCAARYANLLRKPKA